MELLRLYKENKEKEKEYEKVAENRKFDSEFRRLIAAIIEGKEYVLIDNERVFTELGEKHSKEKIINCHYPFNFPQVPREGYKLKITEKLVKKVEDYMSK